MKQKRDSLELFIREQMIGPNGCRGKFCTRNDDGNETEEVINTTPGSIYSTAILFPKKATAIENELFSANSGEVSSEENELEASAQSDADENTRTDANEFSGATGNDSEDEDIYSLSRRFPNTIGLSCCLAENTDIGQDVQIVVSGRYYTKITGANRQNICVVVSDQQAEFELFFNSNSCLHEYFVYSEGLLSIKNISQDYATVRELLRQLNIQCANRIANGDPLFLSIKEEYRFLLSYRELLFNKKIARVTEETSKEEIERTQNRIYEIEKYETFFSYFDDLAEMYDRKSYGFWQSHIFVKPVVISDLPFEHATKSKTIYRPDGSNSLKDIVSIPIGEDLVLSLSAWLQLTYNTKNKNDRRKYLKVLLENTSSPFIEDRLNYFSIVNEKVNQLCFFGINIDIVSEQFRPYHDEDNFSDINSDEDKLNYLYKGIHDYGVGHLCSVNWEKDQDEKVIRVFSEFIPSFETPDIEPIPRHKYGEYSDAPEPYLEDTQCLEFKWLSTFSDASDKEIIRGLSSFIQQYDQWIEEMRAIPQPKGAEFAAYNLSQCQADAKRISDNISGILTNEKHMHSFRMMNSAMYMQLWHNVKGNKEQVREEEPILDPDFYIQTSDEIFAAGSHASWRPFQLAFILLNLDGIIQHPNDVTWEKRNECVDLVWFPTGGGKTEAYLGLIALCIINRRRTAGSRSGGVSTIMRYTLRLLTTQQFQRALRLILALEEMRGWGSDDTEYYLGASPISIGLFVGKGSLPNDQGDLEAEALKWHNRERGKNNTKIPLDECPWCGSKLVYEGGEFCCSNEACTFCDGIPVRLCDEQIYKDPPTLLFGTVDKFAAIAHKVSTKRTEKNKDSRRIFGQGADINFLPPELIIQDELHLLLGPLGSAVSLFECAIDQLCSRMCRSAEGEEYLLRPKIISSTATTRNTELQIRALYDRSVNIFPKNGIDYDDSFFAFYKRRKEDNVKVFTSKRKYIGIMPTGRTQMTTQMRLAAIMLVHRALFESENNHKPSFERVSDYYYSIISYFNSLKEVGKTDAQFYTEYSKYVKRLYKRVLRYGGMLECFYANADLKEAELSGRLSGSEVNEKFTEVAKQWTLSNRIPHTVVEQGSEKWMAPSLPPDYILATNMISVGLDVSRFNTIIINSMPRNIAEYIQASSRVAREECGLVVTLHNPFRSRDVSHFELFREFHEKLYYYVEPISITPFSQKSIEKYLPLFMAAVIRQKYESLADRSSAIKINDASIAEEVKNDIMQYFETRYTRTSQLNGALEKGLLTEELKENIARYVDNALQQWQNMASQFQLVYSKAPRGNNEYALFTSPDDYEEAKNNSFWTVPMSLRIVEPEAVLQIKVK